MRDVDPSDFIYELKPKDFEPGGGGPVEGLFVSDCIFDIDDGCHSTLHEQFEHSAASFERARPLFRWWSERKQHDSGDAGFKLLDQCRGNELLGERGEVRHGVYGLGWQPSWSIGLRI